MHLRAVRQSILTVITARLAAPSIATPTVDARTAGEYMGNDMRAIRGGPEALGSDKVKIGDSPWLGHAVRLDAPVDRETLFKVGNMNGRLASMQLVIDELECFISELHTNHIAKTAYPAGKVCQTPRRTAKSATESL